MDQFVDSEKANLITENKARMYSLRLKSPFSSSKEVYPNYPFDNGNSANSIELERYASQHCHSRSTSDIENREKLQARRKLYIAAIICLIFMVGEVVEILGALLSVLSIWAVTAVLVYLAVQRLISKDFEIESHVMLITSGCAVGVNIIMAVILHQSNPSHSHGHAFGYEELENSTADESSSRQNYLGNTSVRAAFIHVIGDLFQSIGVFVAAIVIFFKPAYKIADPICTFFFSIFVLGSTITILKDVFRVLMEGTPKGMDFNSVKEVLLSIKGVKAMHSLQLWALTLNQPVLSVHIAIEENADAQIVLKEATEILRSKFTFHTTTIQVETFSEEMLDCSQCQDPKD
ncbi:zinc transporter 2 isoform X2 [Scyliorhinus torazame]|uniref:zinc transporter 2 isoform X2 n=1 Tax=Scyliorhinus torazame TaxID=75743 RepID=UPI003B5C6256